MQISRYDHPINETLILQISEEETAQLIETLAKLRGEFDTNTPASCVFQNQRDRRTLTIILVPHNS